MSSRYEDIARAALAESTEAAHVGDWVEDSVREEAPEVTDVIFMSAQAGYRGWSWIVSIAEIAGEAPTVLEIGLLPGEDSLIAPEWTPWSVRLAEWQAQQDLTAEAAADEASDVDSDDDEASDDDDDDADDVLDDDDDDIDADEDDSDIPRATHSGDIDGVDIDDLLDDPAS